LRLIRRAYEDLFEDLIEKALRELGTTSYIEDRISDWKQDKLDEFEKRQLLFKLITNGNVLNNPYFDEIAENLKLELLKKE